MPATVTRWRKLSPVPRGGLPGSFPRVYHELGSTFVGQQVSLWWSSEFADLMSSASSSLMGVGVAGQCAASELTELIFALGKGVGVLPVALVSGPVQGGQSIERPRDARWFAAAAP